MFAQKHRSDKCNRPASRNLDSPCSKVLPFEKKFPSSKLNQSPNKVYLPQNGHWGGGGGGGQLSSCGRHHFLKCL